MEKIEWNVQELKEMLKKNQINREIDLRELIKGKYEEIQTWDELEFEGFFLIHCQDGFAILPYFWNKEHYDFNTREFHVNHLKKMNENDNEYFEGIIETMKQKMDVLEQAKKSQRLRILFKEKEKNL